MRLPCSKLSKCLRHIRTPEEFLNNFREISANFTLFVVLKSFVRIGSNIQENTAEDLKKIVKEMTEIEI